MVSVVVVCSVCGCGLVAEVPFKNTGVGVDTKACEVVSPKLIALITLLRVGGEDFPCMCDWERVVFGLEGGEAGEDGKDGEDGDLVRESCGLEGSDRVEDCAKLEDMLPLAESI